MTSTTANLGEKPVLVEPHINQLKAEPKWLDRHNAEPQPAVTKKSNPLESFETGAVHPNSTADIEMGQQEEDGYLHGLPLVLMTLSLMVGVLMISLDNSIIGKSSFLLKRCTDQSKLPPSLKSPASSTVSAMSVSKQRLSEEPPTLTSRLI